MTTVYIYIRGGVVQDVEADAPVLVKVLDFDIEGCAADDLTDCGDGNFCLESSFDAAPVKTYTASKTLHDPKP